MYSVNLTDLSHLVHVERLQEAAHHRLAREVAANRRSHGRVSLGERVRRLVHKPAQAQPVLRAAQQR